MLRRRSRPPATPTPRATTIRVLAGAPHRVEPVSADLLPSRSRRATPTPPPVPVSVATATGAPVRLQRPRTVDERASRIRAMAQAAARRATGRH
jgi:hypothetical protein